MGNYQLSLKESFSQQKILFYAMVAGVIMIGVLAFAMNTILELDFNVSLPAELIYVGAGVVFLTFFASDAVFKKMLSQVDSTMDLEGKVAKYRSASIVKYALIEGAALLLAVAYMLTGSYEYFMLLGVTIGYFIYVRPTEEKLIDSLNLSYADQQKMGIE